MKNKVSKTGFTLTEILAVIVIISILMLLIAPTIINKIKFTGDDSNEIQNQIVFEATNLYMEQEKEIYPLKPGYVHCIPIIDLIDDGKLSGSVTDFKTGMNYDKMSVKVSVGPDLNNKYEIIDTATCKTTAPDNAAIVISVSPNNNEWSKTKTAKITFPNSKNGYVNQYSTDGINWINVAGTSKELVFNTTGEVSGTAYARVIKNNLTTQKQKKEIKRVDNIAPTCELNINGEIPTSNWYKKDTIISFKEKQDSHSGIASFGLDKTNNSTNTQHSVVNKVDGKEIIYYGSVTDRAGNTNTCSTNFKQDTLAPTLTYGLTRLENNGSIINSIGNNTWSNRNVKRTLYPGDAVSGVSKVEWSTDQSTWYTESYVDSYIVNTDVINNAWFRTTDNAGNVSTPINIVIKVDKTPPWDLNSTYYSIFPAWGEYKHTTVTNFGENFGISDVQYQYCYIGTNCGKNPAKNCANTSIYNQPWLTSDGLSSLGNNHYNYRLGYGCNGYSVQLRVYLKDLAGNETYLRVYETKLKA